MVKHVNFNRDEVLKMPVYERRFFLQKYISELEAQKAARNATKNKKP
jgi:hypothetical protein